MLINNKNIKAQFLNFLIVILVTLSSCNTSEPPLLPDPVLLLTQDEISCTEAWLQLTSANIQLPDIIKFLINGSAKKTFSLSTKDSLLYIDSLLPNQTYSFQVSSIQSAAGGPVSSNELSVTTLDTTSHNFTWQTFEFGQHSSSILYDVAIIDENNIWAVGEIYINDSLGNPDPKRYNAVIWDGTKWSVIRIPYYFQGQPFYNPIHSIFSISQNDIWFCGNGVIHWDGNNFIPIPIPTNVWGPYQMNKLWGSSSNDLYVVGNNGSIAHWDGVKWTKIESGTSVHLLEIWGAIDGSTIWACGYTEDYGTSALIRIMNNLSEKIYEGSSNNQSNGHYVGPMSGVWLDNKYIVFLMTGAGIYIQKSSSEFLLEKEIVKFNHGSYGIDGTGPNNIFACGDEFVGHWNGNSYVEYPELAEQLRTFYNVSVKENIVCAVGYNYGGALYSSAIIALGRK